MTTWSRPQVTEWKRVTCEECEGTGLVPSHRPVSRCGMCSGNRWVLKCPEWTFHRLPRPVAEQMARDLTNWEI